jgi:hypothetical protein
MAEKYSIKSKVSINNVISSEDESDSDLSQNSHQNEESIDSHLNELNDNLDNNNNNNNNKSWAEAINKVLFSKTKNTILSKAKKDKDISFGKRKSDDLINELEFVDKDGNVVNNHINNSDSNQKFNKSKSDESVSLRKKRKNKLSKTEWEVMNRLKPQINDKERERMLASIATKGVVQLFNAVKEQQKSIKNKLSEMGSSETKRDKALSQFTKTQFLDKLKTKKQNNNNVINFFKYNFDKDFDFNFNFFFRTKINRRLVQKQILPLKRNGKY